MKREILSTYRYYFCTYTKSNVSIIGVKSESSMYLVQNVQKDTNESVWVHESTLFNTRWDYQASRFDKLVDNLEEDLIEVKKLRKELFGE